MNLKELLKQRVDNEDLLPDLPQELKDKNTEIVKAYKEGYEQGQKDAERRGRWIFNIDDKGWSWDKPYMCDQCGEWAEKEFKFCPSCGAKMEEGRE